jgi:N-[(2S)-2-amino-2-carboxyethyl]-L-glutamate dehydrogenase
MAPSPSFFVVSGGVISQLLSTGHDDVVAVVREAYLLHGNGQTINPDSYFLRFEDKPDARIIALPAALKGRSPVSGLKWIASYPSNVRANLQRASATLVLNDYATGYPIACLEASQISAARTAASAVLAAEVLGGERRAARLAIVGAGVIARTILEYFKARKWSIEAVRIHDLDHGDASRLAHIASSTSRSVGVVSSADEAVRGASHVVLATTATAPYLRDESLLHPGQVVLNVSLRDLSPQLLLGATNVFDDVEHCMKASTSAHLAEQLTKGRKFVAGTLADVLNGNLAVDASKPIIFSPFGLGVLDVALGQHLLHLAQARNLTHPINDFFPNTARW